MFILSRMDGVPPESFQDQIRQLVIENVSELNSLGLSPDNPLYPLYQYGVGLEVHQYLQSLNSADPFQVGLTLALDAEAPEHVLGFALFLPAVDDLQACALAFLAVASTHRRQGVCTGLLDDVRKQFPRVELHALPHQVAWFEAMGLQAVAACGPQVLMNTTGEPKSALVERLEVDPIYKTLEVGQIHAYLVNQHGDQAMVAAEAQRDERMDELAEQANACMQARRRLH